MAPRYVEAFSQLHLVSDQAGTANETDKAKPMPFTDREFEPFVGKPWRCWGDDKCQK
jgi:hypothetical protein